MGTHYARSARWRSGAKAPMFPDVGLRRNPHQMQIEREERAKKLAMRYPMEPALINAGYRVPVVMRACEALLRTAEVTEAATRAVDKLSQSLQQIEGASDGD